MALITNTQGQESSDKHRIAQLPQLEGFFDTIIIAGESGIPAKPDPAPFLLCLKRLGVSADEAVYVGDDWYIDICGAMNASIQPVWLKHHLVRRNQPDVETLVPIISSLDCLLDLDSIFI